MRKILALFVTASAVVYVAGAFYFFEHEQGAQDPEGLSPAQYGDLRHPDAVLGALELRFQAQHFGAPELSLVDQALRQAPSFYQAPFLLAIYYASRLESPQAVRASYEAALRRYPANGRLHVAFGSWLLESRASLAGWQDPENPAEVRDPLQAAELHLRRGMELEPDLSWRALEALATYRIPPERWLALTPDDDLSRRHLLDALLRGQHYETGFVVLRQSVAETEDVGTLRTAARLALAGDNPELALEAALKWQTLLETAGGASSTSIEATLTMSRAHLAKGDEDAANRVLEQALERVVLRFGASSRITLEFLCDLGDEYLRRGHWVTAESLYGQAASRSPTFVPALHGLARCHLISGDEMRAIESYERVLHVDPEHVQARRALKKLLRDLR